MRSTWIAFTVLLAVSCSNGETRMMSQLGTDVQMEDHTSVPEPHINACGVKFEGSSFEGIPPSGATWKAIWVKAGREICCIAGLCPEEGSPACECYAVTQDPESGTVTVGFAPGFVEGPQEGSEEGLRCREISFVMFESACPGSEDPEAPPPPPPPPPEGGEVVPPPPPPVWDEV